MARAEVYLREKFHLDPSNRLASIHERHRQDRQRSDDIGRTVLETVAQKLGVSMNATDVTGPCAVVQYLWQQQACSLGLVDVVSKRLGLDLVSD